MSIVNLPAMYSKKASEIRVCAERELVQVRDASCVLAEILVGSTGTFVAEPVAEEPWLAKWRLLGVQKSARLRDLIFVERSAAEKLSDSDALSVQASVFRNGGRSDGAEAVAYVRLDSVLEGLENSDTSEQAFMQLRSLFGGRHVT